MKNFKLLLVAAVVFAVGSAFTTTQKTADLHYFREGVEIFDISPCLPPDVDDCYDVYNENLEYQFTQRGTWTGA